MNHNVKMSVDDVRDAISSSPKGVNSNGLTVAEPGSTELTSYFQTNLSGYQSVMNSLENFDSNNILSCLDRNTSRNIFNSISNGGDTGEIDEEDNTGTIESPLIIEPGQLVDFGHIYCNDNGVKSICISNVTDVDQVIQVKINDDHFKTTTNTRIVKGLTTIFLDLICSPQKNIDIYEGLLLIYGRSFEHSPTSLRSQYIHPLFLKAISTKNLVYCESSCCILGPNIKESTITIHNTEKCEKIIKIQLLELGDASDSCCIKKSDVIINQEEFKLDGLDSQKIVISLKKSSKHSNIIGSIILCVVIEGKNVCKIPIFYIDHDLDSS